MGAMDKFQRLCRGVQAIGPSFEIHLKPSESSPGEWAILIVVVQDDRRAAILVNTDFGLLDTAVEQACSRLASISQKSLAAVRPSSPPPAPDTEKE